MIKLRGDQEGYVYMHCSIKYYQEQQETHLIVFVNNEPRLIIVDIPSLLVILRNQRTKSKLIK
jgi:hypothetical protein